MEVVVLGRQLFEVMMVVKLSRVASAIDEPDFAAASQVFSGAWAFVWKERLGETAHRGDSGSGSDEDRVGEWPAEQEESVGAVELNGISFFQVAQEVGEESSLNAVDTNIELIASRGGGDGIGACLRFADRVVGDERDKLASFKVEPGHFRDAEFEVKTLGRLGEAKLEIEGRGKELSLQTEAFSSEDSD